MKQVYIITGPIGSANEELAKLQDNWTVDIQDIHLIETSYHNEHLDDGRIDYDKPGERYVKLFVVADLTTSSKRNTPMM